jgi:hypothetical protein
MWKMEPKKEPTPRDVVIGAISLILMICLEMFQGGDSTERHRNLDEAILTLTLIPGTWVHYLKRRIADAGVRRWLERLEWAGAAIGLALSVAVITTSLDLRWGRPVAVGCLILEVLFLLYVNQVVNRERSGID